MEGYDAKFDPPLDKRLECPICLLAQREPMQTPCGHRFCSSCILRALRETGPRCPVDNTRVCNHQLFKDNFAKREVLSLNVKCSAEECGCPWHGELRSLEMHTGQCELVHIECPNSCGHRCQRKSLGPHLILCTNKPEQCQNCSVHFSRNRMEEHRPNCSRIILPESVQSNLLKANEVLKWCGVIKLKVNAACTSLFQQPAGSMFQVSGYLTAKEDSPESFMFTGNWTSCCSVMPLNAPSAKIFWRTLHGREVQSKFFSFNLLATDSKSNMFFRILKKKVVDMSAVLGLRLKSGRSRNDLTIIYFFWSESKKRLMACVAELKSHLVKQLQKRLHLLHNPQLMGRAPGSDSHSLSRSQSHARSQSRTTDSRSQSRLVERPHRQQQQQLSGPPPLTQPAPSGASHLPPSAPPTPAQHPAGYIQQLHPNLHATHPAVALLAPAPPVPQHLQQPPSHLVHHDSAQPPPMGHPRFLSWQMSQSLNGYPWRVQTGSVPYFSFPSTPPSFLPSNPLPYTFAPAPPFSINQIAQVPNSAVPSYAGLTVQGTVVDSMVPPNGASFPVAAIPSLTDVPNEHLPHGAVAVTITSANAVPGQPAAVVIQQSVMPPAHDVVQNQDVAVLHALGAPPPPHAHYHTPQMPAHIGPALITADGTPAQGLVPNMGASVPGEGVTMGRYQVTPQLVSMAPPPPQHNLMGVSLDYSTDPPPGHGGRVVPQEFTAMGNHSNASSSHFTERSVPSSSRTRVMGDSRGVAFVNDGAGPSRIVDTDSASDNDSMDSDSPRRNFASLIYGMHRYSNYDSDDSSEAPIELDSGDSMLNGDLSGDSQISSDVDDSPGPSSVSDTRSPTNPSTIRHIGGTTATVVISPAPSPSEASSLNLTLNTYESSEDSSPEAATSSDETGTLTLPVLINISDSDSQVTTFPTSVIDLTTTSSATSPGLSESNPSVSSAPSSATNAADSSTIQNQEGEFNEPPPQSPVLERGEFAAHEQSVDDETEVVQLLPHPPARLYAGPPITVQRETRASGERESSRVTGQETTGLYTAATVPVHRMDDGESHVGPDAPITNRRYGTLQRSARRSQREVIVDSQDVQVVGHSVVQMAQPPSHPAQMYTPQGSLAAHTHLIQQQQSLLTYAHDPTQQAAFQSYPAHLPSGSGSVEVQQVNAIPAATPQVVPLETNPAVAMGNNVHMLWQPTLGRPQHAGELMRPAQGVPLPSHPPPAGYPSHQHQGVETTANQAQQVAPGNFWETVMPSLDMSLQGNGVVPVSESLQ